MDSIKKFLKSFSLLDWLVLFCAAGSTILAIPDRNLTAGLGWFCALLWFISSKMHEFMREEDYEAYKSEMMLLGEELNFLRLKKDNKNE